MSARNNNDNADDLDDDYRNNNEDFKWWDQVNLTKLILAANRIKLLPKIVQQLSSLVILDVKKRS